jgi:uncharacterized protein (DUF58 family)
VTGDAAGTPPPAPARRTGWLHPVRPVVPFGLSALVLVGWALVAHNSGSGWVQVVGEAVGAVLVVGLFGPALALARCRVEVLASAVDVTAGDPATLRVGASRRVRLRPVDPPGPDAFAGPRAADGVGDVLEVVAPRHRVVDAVMVDVQSAAPFGIAWWSRRVVLRLPAPLHVAPRQGAPLPLPAAADHGGGEGSGRDAAAVGEPRGVRPYRPGDSRRRVHWPGTAHAGALMVRETEAPVRRPSVIVVTLPGDEEAGERVAEQALGTVLARISQNVPVVLATSEATGPVLARVAHRIDAQRRLARASAGPVGAAGGDSGAGGAAMGDTGEGGAGAVVEAVGS